MCSDKETYIGLKYPVFGRQLLMKKYTKTIHVLYNVRMPQFKTKLNTS
jgi:hypothetical protein